MKQFWVMAHDAHPCRISPFNHSFARSWLDVIVIEKGQEDVDVEQGAHVRPPS